MDVPYSVLNAAIRAIQGESNVNAVKPALYTKHLAQVLAFAPDAHPIVRTAAALSSGLPDLLDTQTIADPALHDVVARSIGIYEGRSVLGSWAQIVPAGWGATHAAALIKAVHSYRCASGDAAALIGPCNESAALLQTSEAVAFAIRRWGESNPANPIAWMNALSPQTRRSLIRTMQDDSSAIARCLPWLPPEEAPRILIKLEDHTLSIALIAFAEANIAARSLHADGVLRLVRIARPRHLDALARLACATGSEDVWNRVQTLIRASPSNVVRIITAMPWHDLPERVRDDILTSTAGSDISDALSAARGLHDPAADSSALTAENASVFFATILPDVWESLAADDRQRWLRLLKENDTHIAIRTLGPRLEFLVRTRFTDIPRRRSDIVHAVRRHTSDDTALRWTLLPIALCDLCPDEMYAVIAALPTPPPDPGAFFVITSEHSNPLIASPSGAVPGAPSDLALAITLQRAQHVPPETLQRTLHGQTWSALKPIMAILDDNARNGCMLNLDATTDDLAPQESLRRTLARLADLPPEIAIPIHVTLRTLNERKDDEAATVIASLLRRHGDLFLSITDAMEEQPRNALLPSLPDPRRNAALRDLARDDPPTAQRLARVLVERSWNKAAELMMELPPQRRRDLAPADSMLVDRLAHPAYRDVLRQALARLATLPPKDEIIVRLALEAMDAGSAKLRSAAANDIAAALHAHGDVFVSLAHALDDAHRAALLPLPAWKPLANALRALACDDPQIARRLTHELNELQWRDAIRDLLALPQRHAATICRALHPSTRRSIRTMLASETRDAGSIADVIHAVARFDLLAALALAAALQADDDDLRRAGIAALASRPDVLRALWGQAPQEIQQVLRAYLPILVAVADIPAEQSGPPARIRRSR